MKYLKHSMALLLLFAANNAIAQRFLNEVFADSDIVVHTNVKFGENYSFLTVPTGQIEDLLMDVYEPNQSIDTLQQRPVMVFVHTGNFLPPVTNLTPNGSIHDSSAVEVCKRWAKRGFVVLAVEYRLGWNPTSLDAEVRSSSLVMAVLRGVQDIKTAVRFIRKDVAESGNTYNADPTRFVLFGDGVGGFVVLTTASLDRFEKILIPKFINQTTQQSYLDTFETGNFDGFGGSKNVSNHPGYSSEINMVINTSGAIADTFWISPGQVPMLSFHCVRDPFAPYNTNVVIVPTTGEPVVEVSGAGSFQRIVDQVGNNCAFDTVMFTDPYSLRAQSLYNQDVAYFDAPFTMNVSSGSGLFPFIRPLSNTRINNESSPWQFWDSVAVATSHGSLGTYAHTNSKQSNPDMSKAKAMAYIDTIMGFSMPRVYLVLNLGNLSEPPNYCYKTLGIGSAAKNTARIAVYPNPADGIINIELKTAGAEIRNVSLADLTGKIVLQETNQSGNVIAVNTSTVPSGIYFVQVLLNNGEQAIRKIVVE